MCPGEILDLTAIITGGPASTSWSGPDGFVSGSADTALVGITAANEGVYTLFVTNSCGSTSASTTFSLYVPAITVTAAPASCGDLYTLLASGAASYSWLPATGLSCTACPGPTTAQPGTYTVTGTTAGGCLGTNTVTVGGNRISGYVSFSGAAPDTLDMKVWLIQFNPADSSLTAIDSTLTCLSGSTPYYEFTGEPAGSYMAKADLIYGITPGSSGYIPTYGLSSPYWDSAATIAHTSAFDSIHINMQYGIVPSGSGFIGGLISSGAGRGTSTGIPVVGMLVYLKNPATGRVLTYTYTDATGSYSFDGLANGIYTIFPEDYQYMTTVSPGITLTTTADTVTGMDFVQHTVSKTIRPTEGLAVTTLPAISGTVVVYPNPTSGALNIQWQDQLTGNADVVVTDVVGREVYRSSLPILKSSGLAQADLSGLKEGVYLITIKSGAINFTDKLLIQK